MTFNLKRFAGKALLSGGAALIGFGLASGTAQAFNPQTRVHVGAQGGGL
jgi:hypothetical protein